MRQGYLSGNGLIPHLIYRVRGRPYEYYVVIQTFLCKIGILGQEAVSRMQRIGSCAECYFD